MKNYNSNRDPTREASRDIVDIVLARPKERRSAPRAAQRPSRHGYRSRVFEPVRGAQMRDGRGIDGARARSSPSRSLSRADAREIPIASCASASASHRLTTRPDAIFRAQRTFVWFMYFALSGINAAAGVLSLLTVTVRARASSSSSPVPSRGEEKRREERRRGLTVRAFVRVRRAVRAG